jgi:PAS domain S-box-containing protein
LDRRLLGYFAALFLPAAALVLVASTLAYRTHVSHQVAAIHQRESMDNQRGAQALAADVEAFSRDVLFLSTLPVVRLAVIEPDPALATMRDHVFAMAAVTKRDVDGISWIDASGRERVRVENVEGQPTIRASTALQDASSRSYFAAINQLEPGAVYIAPLDRDGEPEAGAMPGMAILRIGTPLFGDAGERRGMLVVRYRATNMLAAFEQNLRGIYGGTILVNGEGHPLYIEEHGAGRGVQMERGDSIANRYPEVWARLQSTTDGQFTDENGLWSFATIRPQAIADATTATLRPRPDTSDRRGHVSRETWIILSHVRSAELAELTRPLRTTYLVSITLLLLSGFGMAALLARAWRRRDETMLAEMQREARESTRSLRLILQSNPNAMLIIDRNGAITDANPRAEHVFGYPQDGMRELIVEDLVPAVLRDTHSRHRGSYFAAPHARPMGAGLDLAARRRDGSEFPVEISLAPLTLRGEPFVVATVVDISTRKQAEGMVYELNATLERRVEERTMDLARVEADLRLLLESSASGLYGVDAAGRITFANPAACRILGTVAGRLIGRLAADVLASSEDSDQTGSYLARTLQDGTTFTTEDATFRHASGYAVPVMVSTHPMVRDGQIVGAVVSFIDMTERRRLDEAREKALQEAERLARARSDFLANMSHEIRTPLNGVLGLAQVGHRDLAADPTARDAFARILDSGRTLLGIVDNVLDFSRIEAGKVHVEATPVRLPDLLDEVVASIAPVAEAKRIGLRVLLQPAVPEHCVTDPMRVKQILLNLLANAVKFTAQGEVVLTVDRAADELRFVVRDTGIGISDEQAARIFSAFEQADSSTTRRFGGTGLGLAICQRITELMQGRIEVKSRIGHGSEFTVMLPLVEPPHGTTAPAARDLDSSGSRLVARLAGLRILLAEDNEVNQMVVQAMLSKEGPTVVTVADGALAVEAVRREGPDAFDIVLMDIQMPGMDGYEATRLIHDIAPDLPVVGQTAHVLQEAIEQCREAGMVAHLPKPIDRHELIMTIMRYARRTAPQA